MPPFAPHPVLAAVLCGAGALHVGMVKEPRRRKFAFAGWLVLALAVLWPVGDLAASVSLSVATIQRLVIMLGVAPLLIAATSTQRITALTRPRLLDALSRTLAHPAVSIAFVTAVGTSTLSTPVVDEGAQSNVVRAITVAAVLVCGIVLWVPVLGVLPGARRLSPVGRAGFLFVASLVVTSLSIVWIFARHSLYPGLQHQSSLWNMTPLLDQQLAGFVAKLGSYVPMWAVAFSILSRADDSGEAVEASPMHWADVERQLLRIDRQRARSRRRRGRRRPNAQHE